MFPLGVSFKVGITEKLNSISKVVKFTSLFTFSLQPFKAVLRLQPYFGKPVEFCLILTNSIIMCFYRYICRYFKVQTTDLFCQVPTIYFPKALKLLKRWIIDFYIKSNNHALRHNVSNFNALSDFFNRRLIQVLCRPLLRSIKLNLS